MFKSIYVYAFLIIILFVVGYIFGSLGIYQFSNDSQKTFDFSKGSLVRFVYIGSSKCIYSNNERTHEMVSYIKSELKSIYDSTNTKFFSTGISIDLNSEVGVPYLSKTGPYNEILVGGGPLNLGLINYSSGLSSTPKILISFEEYKTKMIGLNSKNLNDAQKMIKTFTGQIEIKSLYELLKNKNQNDIHELLEVH